MEQVNVLVVGAGQAGLALSHELKQRGVEHVVLERGRIGQTWRDRWDSFCLVTPNWSVQLPGGAYAGDDPDGFMPRDEIVRWFEDYAAVIGAPVRDGVEVRSVSPARDGGFQVATSAGDYHAQRVAMASGAYQRPHRPVTDSIPASILQLDVADYRRPEELPDGGVLVIGSGQSGLQIAEELHLAGREVVVSCGRAPWVPRRIGDEDVFWWAHQTGFLDQPVEALPDPAERLTANLQNSGAGGGHSLHYRTLRDVGVTLVGRFVGADEREMRFAPDLGASVAWGDQRYGMFMGLVRRHAAERGVPVPEIVDPAPFDGAAPERLPVARFGTVLHATGFRPAYREWLPWPDAFDDIGFPIHRDGESVMVSGLHFVGVHFLRKRKSSLLIGVGEDAAVVAGSIAGAAA